MNFSKYTTQELEFIASNIELLKKELEKRNIKESNDFLFKTGDIIHRKFNDDNFLLKIKEIDKSNNNVVADEIIIRDGGLFDFYIDEWFGINGNYSIEWHEYVKIEDSEIFKNLINIINKHDNDLQQLNDDTYLRLKNEIAPYDR